MENELWANVDAAVDHIKKVCEDGHHPVHIDSRTTIAAFNWKTKNEDFHITDIPGSAVYSLKWVCKHYGDTEVRVSA